MPTIGMAAKLAGCNVETIRYYERIGILPQPPRKNSGRRSYGDAEIKQLRFIRRCRDLGFSLKEVEALIALSLQSKQNCGQIKAMAESHRTVVRRKMADLARIEVWLSDVIGQCAAKRQDECPMLQTLFAQAHA